MTYDEALQLYFEGCPEADQPNEKLSRLISGSWYLRNIHRTLAQVGTPSRVVIYHCRPGSPRYVPPSITLRESLMFRAYADGYRLQSIAEAFSVSRSHVRVVLGEVRCKLDARIAARAA